MERKKLKKLVLKKDVIERLSDKQMDYVWGGRCSPVASKYYDSSCPGYTCGTKYTCNG